MFLFLTVCIKALKNNEKYFLKNLMLRFRRFYLKETSLGPKSFSFTIYASFEYNYQWEKSRKINKKHIIMTAGEVLQLGQEALWVILKIGLPLMLAALFLGLIISFIQALTQIQEMTLSFVPKIVGIFVLMLVLFPYFGTTLQSFTEVIFDKIIGVK